MNDKVLLIGNGINTINNNDYTWKNLIENLIDFIGAGKRIGFEGKPFPLLYEQIVTKSIKKKIPESEVKKFIAKEVEKLQPNSIHERILDVGFANVLTTNYDYTFENINGTNKKFSDDGVIKQKTYSLFRNNLIDNQRIWHIHGEANVSNSIMLGYEHYSGYLQNMREYVISGKKFTKYQTGPLKEKIANNSFTKECWIDFFFTNDVHILRLTLDYVEIHLWWLLTSRARRIQEGQITSPNTVFYYYPEEYEKEINHNLDLLESSQVQTFAIKKENDWEKYYNKIIDKIIAL